MKAFDAVLARFIIESVLSLIGGVVVLILLWWFMDLTLRTDTILGAFRSYMELHILCFGVCLSSGSTAQGSRSSTRRSRPAAAVSSGVCGLSPAGDLPPDAQYVISYTRSPMPSNCFAPIFSG